MAKTGHPYRHVVAACYLGWTLDAFDYFIMVLVFDEVAREFHASRTLLTFAITLTLAMRPLGAFLFGRLADRFGRRPTLMANVAIYSVLEFCSGLAPDLTSFFILRALYGVAMGGEWGVGASLTMETIPARWRGPVSGLLQAGYPSGFLLATLLYREASASVGWRGLFMLGVLPALLVFYIRRNVPESPDWKTRTADRSNRPGFLDTLRQNFWLTVFAVAMMTAFNFYSHGTQDLYKSFLATEHKLSVPTISAILVAMNVAAIIGGLSFGALSQRFGRRRGIIVAALLSLPVIPLWAFARDPWKIGLGAFLMQFFVQGAWGIVPAHLNEISPPDIRGTFPGLTYQLGNFLSSANASIQSYLADTYFGHDLSWPLAIVAGGVAVIIAVLVGFGREAKEREMGAEDQLAKSHDA